MNHSLLLHNSGVYITYIYIFYICNHNISRIIWRQSIPSSKGSDQHYLETSSYFLLATCMYCVQRKGMDLPKRPWPNVAGCSDEHPTNILRTAGLSRISDVSTEKHCPSNQVTRPGPSNAPNSVQSAVLTSFPRHFGTRMAPDSKQRPWSSDLGPSQRGCRTYGAGHDLHILRWNTCALSQTFII